MLNYVEKSLFKVQSKSLLRFVVSSLKYTNSFFQENVILILIHLILHIFVRIKCLLSNAGNCTSETNVQISPIARYLFFELSRKKNVIYNIISDFLSSLGVSESCVEENKFQTVMKHSITHFCKVEKHEDLSSYFYNIHILKAYGLSRKSRNSVDQYVQGHEYLLLKV